MYRVISLTVLAVAVLAVACGRKPEVASETFDSHNERASTRSVVVFVHGILGDSKTSWAPQPGTGGWPDIVLKDPKFPVADIVAIGYRSAPVEASSNIEEISVRTLQQLSDRGVFANYDKVAFIAHSMGGLITKRMLALLQTKDPSAFLRVRAVLFFSTPAYGSSEAEIASWMSGNPQFGDLRPSDFNTFLQSLDNSWRAILNGRPKDLPFPRSFCAYETLPTQSIRVVPRSKSEAACDNIPIAFDRNHETIVKPTSVDDEVHRFARARIVEAFVSDKQTSCTTQPPAAVHIARRSFVSAGCGAGGRFFDEEYVDTLTFTAPVSCYRVQARRDPASKQELVLKYTADGNEVIPALVWTRDFGGVETTDLDVPVDGTSFKLTYAWTQRPPATDKVFGVGVTSSLPILSFKATTNLPTGKAVLGLDSSGENAGLVARFKDLGCTLDVGNVAELKCLGRPVTTEPNKALIVPWKWDVFAGC